MPWYPLPLEEGRKRAIKLSVAGHVPFWSGWSNKDHALVLTIHSWRLKESLSAAYHKHMESVDVLVLLNPSRGDVLIGAFYMDFVLHDLKFVYISLQETNTSMPCLPGFIR